jgi:hypothetical protein
MVNKLYGQYFEIDFVSVFMFIEVRIIHKRETKITLAYNLFQNGGIINGSIICGKRIARARIKFQKKPLVRFFEMFSVIQLWNI